MSLSVVGEPEKALEQLEPLLKIPYYLSPGWLKIDPTCLRYEIRLSYKRQGCVMVSLLRSRFPSLPTHTKWILALVCAALSLAPREASAQEEQDTVPLGAHHAGRGPDTGGGAGYATSVPLDLPAARGGLPIPVRLDVGGTRVGALGRGGDVQLSYIRDLSSFAQRRRQGHPECNPLRSAV